MSSRLPPPHEGGSADSAELARQKLQLEVDELGRKWIWKSGNLSAVFTGMLAVAAVVGAVTTWRTGYFSVERSRLEAQSLLLQIQIARFENEKNRLQSDNARLQQEKAQLSAGVQRNRTDLLTTERQLAAAEMGVELQKLLFHSQRGMPFAGSLRTGETFYQPPRGVSKEARAAALQRIRELLSRKDGHLADRLKPVRDTIALPSTPESAKRDLSAILKELRLSP